MGGWWRGLAAGVAADSGRRVRVLLLARSAGEWWQQLGAASAGVRQMVAAAGQGMTLAEEVAAQTSDLDVVEQALPCFAAALGVPEPRRVAVELGEGPQRILDLHAAALVAVLRSISAGAGAGSGAEAGSVTERVPVRVADVLEELLGQERRYWVQSVRARSFLGGSFGLSVSLVEQTVAVGTLLGARDRVQAAEVVGRVPDGVASVLVADWLRELYPPGDGEADREWLGRLRPDRLAELHTSLGVRFSALGRAADALPAEQEAVAIRRELAERYPDLYRPALAHSLSNLSVTFSELGRPKEAARARDEAERLSAQ